MLIFELQKLISSLSAAEKKYFRLYSAKLKGAKDYLLLYDLALDGKDNGSAWEDRFRELYPGKSFDNAANYLFKVLTDVLVQIRIEQDTWFAQHHYLLKARLCLERSMPNRARKMLTKAYTLASKSQNHTVSYQALRMELTALADLGFPQTDEQDLVDKQMKAKLTLQSLRQLQEHYSLYELLSHRLTKGTLSVDKKSDKKINDLILSELSLTTRGSQYEFEPQKLHLLFQSFFFIHTGEYHSALRIFNELNKLIESNQSMWDFPPYDYLSALDGILDSLRSIGYYWAMTPFIEKVFALGDGKYPEHFCSVAKLTANTYQLNMHLGTGKTSEALAFITQHRKEVSPTGGGEQVTQLEFDFFESLTFFLSNQLGQANKSLNPILSAEKHLKQLPVYRAARLLHILLAYEQDDLDYLEYEIRSYKRIFTKFDKVYKTEKLVFNTIGSDPRRRGNAWKESNHKKLIRQVQAIKAEKREMQLLKYFDYTDWVLAKFRQ